MSTDIAPWFVRVLTVRQTSPMVFRGMRMGPSRPSKFLPRHMSRASIINEVHVVGKSLTFVVDRNRKTPLVRAEINLIWVVNASDAEHKGFD